MSPFWITSWLFMAQSLGSSYSDPYLVRKTGVTYKVQFESPQDNTIKGKFQANGLTFQLTGNVLNKTAKGQIESNEKLSFKALFIDDKLHFDIFKTNADGELVPNLGQLLILKRQNQPNIKTETQ